MYADFGKAKRMNRALPIAAVYLAFATDFIVKIIPSKSAGLGYALDLVLALLAAYVLLRFLVSGRLTHIRLRYWLAFLAFAYVVISGILINGISPEVAFAGLRTYFKYVPLFLLPALYDWREIDARLISFGVVGLCLLQVPLVIYQRFFLYSEFATGDVVVGTQSVPAANTLLSMTAILILFSAYLTKALRPQVAIVLVCACFVPAILNETKVTPMFLVLGVLALLLAHRGSIAVRHVPAVAALLGVMTLGFLFGYDVLYGEKSGGYLNVVTSKERALDSYNFKGINAKSLKQSVRNPSLVAKPLTKEGADGDLLDEEAAVGRLDSIRLPFVVLYPDEPLKLLFGLGVGNMLSTFGSGGEYLFIKHRYAGGHTELSLLLWETGLLGTLCFLVFLIMLAVDAYRLSGERTWRCTLGAAGFATICMWIVNTGYKSLFNGIPTMLILFMLLGGAVAALRSQQLREAAWARPNAAVGQVSTI